MAITASLLTNKQFFVNPLHQLRGLDNFKMLIFIYRSGFVSRICLDNLPCFCDEGKKRDHVFSMHVDAEKVGIGLCSTPISAMSCHFLCWEIIIHQVIPTR